MTARELENLLRSEGLSRSKSKMAVAKARTAGLLTDPVMPAQEQPPKRGILSTIKTALTGRK